MAKKTAITLVAAQTLVGGTAKEPFTVEPGTVIDGDVAKSLGVDADEVQALQDRGALVEASAYEGATPLPAGQTAPGTTGTEFEGMSIDAMHAFLDEAGIEYPEDANGPDLMKIALEHQHPSDVDREVAAIEADKAMNADAIRKELGELQVPFETDANKPTLTRLLAETRVAKRTQA